MDIYTVMIRSILDPLYDSFSRSFSNISMRYRKLRDEEAIAHREPQTIAVWAIFIAILLIVYIVFKKFKS